MLCIMNANGPNGSNRSTLVLFCRQPQPGVGKQRLAVDLGIEDASILAQKLLDTALEDANVWPGPLIISPADPADADWASSLLARDVIVMPQTAGNLGARLNTVDRLARRDGHSRLIYIGSDSPLLTGADFTAACDTLYSHDVVLLPADDGGVTLMGARVPWPPLANLRWSSEYLAADLERLCTAHGHTVNKLQPGYDVDRATDLPRLLIDLATDERPARVRLRNWLKQHHG